MPMSSKFLAESTCEKNCKNWSIFSEHMDKVRQLTIFGPPCLGLPQMAGMTHNPVPMLLIYCTSMYVLKILFRNVSQMVSLYCLLLFLNFFSYSLFVNQPFWSRSVELSCMVTRQFLTYTLNIIVPYRIIASSLKERSQVK